MKRVSVALALTALAAATVAVAQTTPQTSADQPAQTTSQQQYPNSTTPPADQGAGTSSSADKQALIKDCLKQVQAANPNAAAKDVKEYCDKQVNSSSPK